MNADITLYRQISRKLENDILAGKFPPGCRIPAVRELAVQYQVNPNTVQWIVRGLKQTGLLVSSRGRETLVTDDVDSSMDSSRNAAKNWFAALFGKWK